MVEVLLKSSQSDYKGFKLLIKDFQNTITGHKRREVYIYNMSAPMEVANRLQLMLMENRINYFDTRKEAESCITTCYTGLCK